MLNEHNTIFASNRSAIRNRCFPVAPPQTLLGELTALPRPLAAFKGPPSKGRKRGKERGRKERGGEKSGEEREGRN